MPVDGESLCLEIHNVGCIFSRDTGSKTCLAKDTAITKNSELKDGCL